MVYSAVNHSYDSKTTIKIISGIKTMIYSSINHSYDSNRTNKIISRNHNRASMITSQVALAGSAL